MFGRSSRVCWALAFVTALGAVSSPILSSPLFGPQVIEEITTSEPKGDKGQGGKIRWILSNNFPFWFYLLGNTGLLSR